MFLGREYGKAIYTKLVSAKGSRDRRVAKGMVVAISCEIVAIDDDQQKGTYKVQSETDVNKYYIVKFMDGTPICCSCKDLEIQIRKNERQDLDAISISFVLSLFYKSLLH